MLTFFFKGLTYDEMEKNPLDSKDLNYGVPPYFNQILDNLLDATAANFLLESCGLRGSTDAHQENYYDSKDPWRFQADIY